MRKDLLIFCGLFALVQLQSQVEVPGEIRGDYRQTNGADALYLLPPVHPMEKEAFALQQEERRLEKSHLFAFPRPLELNPGFHGVWEESGSHRIWRVHLHSPGARSLGLTFGEFRLEEGVHLMVYTPDLKYVRGAYSSLNNKSSGILALGHTPGEELIVELQVPSGMEDYGELSLSTLSHGFFHCTGYGCAGECQIDIVCEEGDKWRMEQRSVVRVNTPAQYCTGVLVNNTSYNGDPLLLTAKHCISTQGTAERTVFEFQYESPECFGGNGSLSKSISGAELLAVGDSVDFALLRLSLDPPASYGAWYAGWDLRDQQSGPTTTIHHPWGDVKKISADFDVPDTPSSIDDIYYEEWRKYHYYSFWWIGQWDSGSTEPGSSGSPLFTDDRRVIGLLSWGSAVCGDSIGYDTGTDRVIYDPTNNINDFYTKLNVAWDDESDPAQSLYSWLDPGQTGANRIGAYDPLSTDPGIFVPGNSFRVYPNPSQGMLHLEPAVEHLLDCRIFDLRGRLCQAGELRDGFLQLHPALPPGIYLLHLETAMGIEYHKIILE